MAPGLRRLAWWSFVVVELGLVAAGSAYVGVGTRDFWLMLAAAVVAFIAYAVTIRTTRVPGLGETALAPPRWYWF